MTLDDVWKNHCCLVRVIPNEPKQDGDLVRASVFEEIINHEMGYSKQQFLSDIRQWALENLVGENYPFVSKELAEGYNLHRQELIDRIDKIGGE